MTYRGFYFSGYIRDLTGSYQGSFFMMGSGLLLGTVCLFCEPIAKKLEDERVNKLQQCSKTNC